MSTFIPITNAATADLLSRRLFELSRPAGVPCEGCVTSHLLQWVTHPETGAVMMEIPEGFDFPVHQIADGETVRPIIQPFVTAGKVPVKEVDDLVALVQTKVEDRVAVWDLIPAFWKGLSKTREELELEGWFPKLELKTGESSLVTTIKS
jgi:hypothetical protein